jgi:hypothetical protein
VTKPCLNAITLGVSDLARSVRFYQDLGFERRMKATGDEIAFFDAGGISLALWHREKLADDAGVPAEPPSRAFRDITLAQLCRTDKDVDLLMSKALAAGATLLKPAQQTSYGGYSAYFADPDGHVWEAVRAPGFSFTEHGRVTLPD